MRRINVVYVLLVVVMCAAVSATPPVRTKYSNVRLGYEVNLPPGTVCMNLEPDNGCGFNIAIRSAEVELKPDSLPARYMWVSGELNTGAENTLERAVQKTATVETAGRAGAIVLNRQSRRASGLPATELEISYNSEDGEALEKIVIVYRERKGSPSVIYTFGLHTPRGNEDGDVRLFHEFVSGFGVR